MRQTLKLLQTRIPNTILCQYGPSEWSFIIAFMIHIILIHKLYPPHNSYEFP